MKNAMDTVSSKRPLSMKRATVLLSFLGGFRMGIGLVCSVLVAMAFGASIETDAYNVGTYLPMVLMCFAGLDLMRAILVSVFSKLDVVKKEEPSQVFSSIITVLGIISIFVIGVGLVLTRPLVNLVAPEVTEVTTRLATHITRIAIPGIILMMLGAMTSAVLLAYHEYAKSQVFDILSKLILAVSAAVCIFIPNIYILTFGFVGGQLIAAMVTLRLLSGLGLRYRPQIQFSPIVREILGQSFPVWVGVIATYIGVTIQRRYASAFEAGSITSLRYAETIFSAMVTMVSVPLFRALSPRVARNVALKEHDEEARLFWACFKQGSCIAVVLTALIWLRSNEIVSVLFQRGRFDLKAVDITASLFTWIGIGVWGNIISYQAIAIMFAHKKTHLSMILNIASNSILCLIIFLTIDRYGIKAIGIGYGISQLLRGLMAVAMITGLLGYRFCNIGQWFIRFFLTSIVSVAALKVYVAFCSFGAGGFLLNLLNLIGAFVTIVSVFIIAGCLLKLTEAVSFLNLVKAFLLGSSKKIADK